MGYKVFSLIPRVRVNFSLKEVFSSIFVSEKSDCYKNYCNSLLSDFFDGEDTLLVGSGRAALYHIIKVLPQKKVFIPAYNCIVVPEAVAFAKKEIFYIPTDHNTFNSNVIPELDSDSIMIATHQFGFACDIERIHKACKDAGAVLIEDCAAAMGTTVNGKKVGTFGDFAIVSFNSTKLLNIPSKGGLIVAKNHDDMIKIKGALNLKKSDLKFKAKHLIRGVIYCLTKNKLLYRCYHYLAIDRKNKIQRTEHEGISTVMEDSYMYEFTEWQSSILLRQIQNVENIAKRRLEIFKEFDCKINNPLLKKPIWHENEVCCRYPVLVKNRIAFYKKCLNLGLDMDFSHCSLACPSEYAEEHRMAEEVLDIPYYYDLSDKEIDKIIKIVNSIRL